MKEFESRITALTPDRQKTLARRLRDKLLEITSSQSQVVGWNVSGSCPPLFCIHPSGGDVLCYSDFAACLGLDQPVYAIRAKGLEEGEEPCLTIEGMACEYIRHVERIAAAGPYFLGGWSMGAVVAFEMARQISNAGGNVQMLALFDMWVLPEEQKTEIDDALVLTALLGRHLPVSLEFLRSLSPDEQLDFALKQAKSAGLFRADVDLNYARRIVRLCRTNDTAVQNYSPASYCGKITLFRSVEERDARFGIRPETADSSFGWSRFAEQGVDTYLIPGNHDNLMVRPQVEHLAAALKTCLRQAGMTSSNS